MILNIRIHKLNLLVAATEREQEKKENKNESEKWKENWKYSINYYSYPNKNSYNWTFHHHVFRSCILNRLKENLCHKIHQCEFRVFVVNTSTYTCIIYGIAFGKRNLVLFFFYRRCLHIERGNKYVRCIYLEIVQIYAGCVIGPCFICIGMSKPVSICVTIFVCESWRRDEDEMKERKLRFNKKKTGEPIKIVKILCMQIKSRDFLMGKGSKAYQSVPHVCIECDVIENEDHA